MISHPTYCELFPAVLRLRCAMARGDEGRSRHRAGDHSSSRTSRPSGSARKEQSVQARDLAACKALYTAYQALFSNAPHRDEAYQQLLEASRGEQNYCVVSVYGSRSYTHSAALQEALAHSVWLHGLSLSLQLAFQLSLAKQFKVLFTLSTHKMLQQTA